MRQLEPRPEEAPFDGAELPLATILESLLLVAGEPLAEERLADLTNASVDEVSACLAELQASYLERGRGIQLRQVGGGYRLHTHPACAAYVERLAGGRRSRLTRATLETLAIIAYLQPITRSQIAALRGVVSESLTRTLEDMELVEEVGKDVAPGGPALYGTTSRLLELLGIASLDDLPPLEDLAPDAETVERIKRSLSGEAGEAAGTPWEPVADENGEEPAPE